MTSPTYLTKARRRMRRAECGAQRKAAIRRNGSTPELFALNRPTEWELASKKK